MNKIFKHLSNMIWKNNLYEKKSRIKRQGKKDQDL